jgi:peroxin-2
VAEFVNYAVFILRGEFRTLTQRVLGMAMRFIDPENKRILNFSLMNRMLVWQVYELFLKTVLPHFFAFCAGPLKNLFYLSSFLQPEGEQKGCVFCTAQQPVMPRQALPCRHTACYYCASTSNAQKCPLCSQPVDRWAPLH